MKRLLVLSLIIIIMLPLSAAREEDIDLKLSLEDIGKVEIGFSSSAIESWTDNASTVSEVTLEPKTDGKAYLEQDLYAYAKVQSNYPGHIYLISDELIGYKMPWYRSATCSAVLQTTHSTPITIPAFTQFMTEDGISYATVNSYSGLTEISPITVDIVQGIPQTQQGYIVNSITDLGRIYLSNQMVDQSNFLLTINGQTWTQIDNFLDASTAGRYFEFSVDSDNLPYLQLVPYYQDFPELSAGNIASSTFILKYLVSSGSSGTIGANALRQIVSPIMENGALVTNTISIASNTDSTQGYDPETPEEALVSSERFAVTPNVLVTLKDYRNAANSIDGVGNSIAVNSMSDFGTTGDTPTNPYELWLYAVSDNPRSSTYPTVSSDAIAQINTEFQNRGVSVYTGGSSSTGFFRQGEVQPISLAIMVYPISPLTDEQMSSVSNAIISALQSYFSPQNRQFGETLSYIDIVNSIVESDDSIRYISLSMRYNSQISSWSSRQPYAMGNLSVPSNLLPSLTNYYPQGTSVGQQIGISYSGISCNTTVNVQTLSGSSSQPVSGAVTTFYNSITNEQIVLQPTESDGTSTQVIPSGIYDVYVTASTGSQTGFLTDVVLNSPETSLTITVS